MSGASSILSERTKIISAAVDTVYSADGVFSYALPHGLEVGIGDMVTVPFGKGNRQISALVLDVTEGNAEGLKTVISKKHTSIGPQGVAMVKFLKSKCFCTYMDGCRLVQPAEAKNSGAPLYHRFYALAENLDELLAKTKKLTEKQSAVIRALSEGHKSASDLEAIGIGRAVLKTLESKGMVRVVLKQIYRNPLAFAVRQDDGDKKDNDLNAEQQKAFEEIKANLTSGSAHLLYGVTGSGKTHVFMALIDEVLAKGQSVILLIPEISLTFQIIKRLYGRYGDLLAVLHSGLSKGERADEWERIEKGIARIVVGTRSAVFAPAKKLGLIIMDEEQEHTYKSEMTPRYSAKDVALFRMHSNKGLLLLASATPSFESFYRAKEGIIGYSRLTERFNGHALPKVITVDLRYEAASGNTSSISRLLAREIELNLKNGEQTILFINRRGYAGFVQCTKCSKVHRCPSCGIPLSYHMSGNTLTCHYCGYSVPSETYCSDCGAKLRYSGTGTQKAEEQLSKLFPSARIVRMDADSVAGKNSREDILKAFGNKEYDILLGTQMITKGLDFPSVTLVGVLNADSMLYSSDFRAYEKTFSLLTQVTGRAGRSEKSGRAVIQTYSPEHEVLKFAYAQDYEDFYESQIPLRRNMLYPPFSELCQAVFVTDGEEKAFAAANRYIEYIKKKLTLPEYQSVSLSIIRPAVTSVPMVDGRSRVRIIIKCRDKAITRRLFSAAHTDFIRDPEMKNVSAALDMNPQNIL